MRVLGSQLTAKGTWSRHRGHWKHTLDAAAGPAEGILGCLCFRVYLFLCVQAPIVGQVQYLSGLFFLEASLMAQTVKHLPAMWETWVPSLDQEDTLDKEMATHSSIVAWKSPWRWSLVCYSPWGSKQSATTEQLYFRYLFFLIEGQAQSVPRLYT